MELEDDEDIRRNLHSHAEAAAAVVAGLVLRNLVEEKVEHQQRKRN